MAFEERPHSSRRGGATRRHERDLRKRFEVSEMVSAEDVRWLTPTPRLSELFSREELLNFSGRLANIAGRHTEGRTAHAMAIRDYASELGWEINFLPEITDRPIRPWERQGQYVRSVTPRCFDALLAAGRIVHPYIREESNPHRCKRGGFWIKDLERVIRSPLPCLAVVNVLALLRLEKALCGLPAPSIILVSDAKTHRRLQRMRGVPPTDSAGMSIYGVSQPDGIRTPYVSGSIWLENWLVPGVGHLCEEERLAIVVPELVRRFRLPLTSFEASRLTGDTGILTRGELVLQVVNRHLPEDYFSDDPDMARLQRQLPGIFPEHYTGRFDCRAAA